MGTPAAEPAAIPPPTGAALDRRDLWIALLLALVALAFRLPWLGSPPEEIFDEVYHAKTALQYLNREQPTEWVHPPTAKLLIAIPVWLLGYDAWSWRLASALAGIALAPVFYVLARAVLATRRAAVLASVLLLADGVYLVQSRTAMTNIFAVLFQVGAAMCLVRSVVRERLSLAGMAGLGLFLGLALSTRWTSLWAWGFLGVILLAVRQWRILRARELALSLLAFVALPLLIYVISYLPLMEQRHDVHGWKEVKAVAQDLVQEQKNVWGYHANLRAEHPYFTNWYTWAWLYRPTWYYFDQPVRTLDPEGTGADAALRTVLHLVRAAPSPDGPMRVTWVRGIVAIGNPVLWWVSIPICLWALATGLHVRRRPPVIAGAVVLLLGCALLWLRWDLSMSMLPSLTICAVGGLLVAAGVLVVEPRRVFAGLGFLALYVPWGISPRTLNYAHYLFEGIPYACLALGILLDRHWDREGRVAARVYLTLVVLMFLYFLPFLVAIPVPASWYYQHLWPDGPRPWTWFPTWV